MDGIGDQCPARASVARSRRWTVLRAVLAGGIVLGIGAGVTSAAWTDSAFFAATANSATVKLETSTTGADGSWLPADTTPGVAFAGAAFNGLLPGQTRISTIYLRNAGTVCLDVPAPAITKSEPLSGLGATDASVTVDPAAVGNMGPGTTSMITVTVVTPADWNVSHQDKPAAQALVIQFQGSAVVGSSSTGACPP